MNYADFLPFLVIVNGIVVIAVLIAIRYRKQQRCRRQHTGVIWLQKLRIMLSLIQQHRGMTTGYLNGSTEMLPQINDVHNRVNRAVADICAVDPWMESNDRWQSIVQHWGRLSVKFRTNEFENNLTQHNKLIQNLLYLIDDMASDHDLLLLKGRDEKPVRYIWRELLTAGECIGQARALGTGIVASRHCDTVSRIRLNYLCQKIERQVDVAWNDLPPTQDQKEKLKALLSCVSEELTKTHPTIEVSAFFAIASSALDGLHDQYDSVVGQLV